MQWYYGKLNENDQLELNGDEAHHCKNVMRIKPGNELMVTDGMGNLWLGSVAHYAKQESFVDVKRHHVITSRPQNLHIAICPTKNIDRFEWFLEKATEIGVERITPLITHRTERNKLNHERLTKVLISAMKQSQQTHLPELGLAIDIKTFLDAAPNGTLKLVCHAHESTPIQNHLQKNTPTLVLIGPEGDFTDEELGLAKNKGFKVTSLGANRLRTETAGIMVCASVSLLG